MLRVVAQSDYPPLFFIREMHTPPRMPGEDSWRWTSVEFTRADAEAMAARIERATEIARIDEAGAVSPEELNRGVTVAEVVSAAEIIAGGGQQALYDLFAEVHDLVFFAIMRLRAELDVARARIAELEAGAGPN